ncbi:MAG: APC family permease [Planctomycetes bacterium]|nr:APC family permease [Planctomycetota bacterium]
MSLYDKVKRILFGESKDPRSPAVYEELTLVAFLAWVGLGADGLSSSCYGPEEAYLALGAHHGLAIFLALAAAITVYVISASYSQVIELFPSGGGDYLVATKLLGSHAGLVGGCALFIDYVLTISISIASGADAIFSLMDPSHLRWKFSVQVFSILLLVLLNLRGVKESIKVLLPIFVTFLITHALILGYGVCVHATEIPALVGTSVRETRSWAASAGWMPVLMVFFTAYSLGGGTYTGIEAVSNGMQILREPKVRTGKLTMHYMAASLALTAGGILLCYLLIRVAHVEGQTLNATMMDSLVGGWRWGDAKVGLWLVWVALVSEGALLFVAAQAGFLAGPRVLANMALDSWVPRRFAQLSDRLVVGDGVVLMGLAALGVLIYAQGSVKVLIVMYSINVFLTFSLSQIGMCLHWWRVRRTERRWRTSFLVNGVGLLLTTGILVITTILKFEQGGWVTVALTVAFVILCLFIHRHYDTIHAMLADLDRSLAKIPMPPGDRPVPEFKKGAPTAVLMVSGFNGLGIHSFFSIFHLFHGHFVNFIFVSVGVIDFSRFKGAHEIENLQAFTDDNLKKYVELAHRLGKWAEFRSSLGAESLPELEALCARVQREFPNCVFFSGRLVFPEETTASRLLHNQVAFALQRRFHMGGMPMMVLPIRAR